MSRPEQRDVLGVPLSCIDMAGVIERTLRWAGERRSAYVCEVCASSIVDSKRDPLFAEALMLADLNLADGAPVAWGMSALGVRGQERLSGPSVMLSVLAAAQDHGLGVLLYGSTEEILGLLSVRLAEQYPALKIVGAISPPFRPLTPDEDECMVAEINGLHPDVIFVALGAPRQEAWMLDHRGRVPGVMFGVGAAFEYNAGLIRRAPAAMQSMGLEWSYRLAQQPRRMFGRYLRTLPSFAVRLAWQVSVSWAQRATAAVRTRLAPKRDRKRED
jgi:N-acetylglucosaminyldiphosphoundecaprenol N-acetyl-beta-D-mannosaminyltransferase